MKKNKTERGAAQNGEKAKRSFQLKWKKPTKNQTKRFLIHFLYILLGNAIAAAATAFLIVPNNLVMGGTSGIGIFIRNLMEQNGVSSNITEWVVQVTVYAANIVLFIIGAIFMGKKYAAATLAGTLLYPTFMTIYKPLNDLYIKTYGVPVGGSNLLLAAVIGALIFGLGIGIVVRVGASTGGTDIPPMILHKYFNLPVSVTMMCLDCTIVALQLIAKEVNIDIVFYGFIITILASVVIEVVSPIGMRKAQVKIISKKYREIREMILTKMNRGVTMLYGKSGFLQQKCFVIMTVVSNRDVVKLKNEIWQIDPSAFITISVISEVRGNGFSTDEKIALPKQEMGADTDLEDVTEQFNAGRTLPVERNAEGNAELPPQNPKSE